MNSNIQIKNYLVNENIAIESFIKLWYYINGYAGIVQWLVHLVANEGTAVRICLLAPVENNLRTNMVS